MKSFVYIICSIFFALTILVNADGVRFHEALNSGWDGVQVENVAPQFPDSDVDWHPVELPLFKGGHSLMLRRYLYAPEEWQGRRVSLTCEFCNYRTRVIVNGQEAGDHIGGFGIFNIDLTSFLKYGSTNEVMLCISGPVLDENKKAPDSLSYGQSWQWGVLGGIELNVFNQDHIYEIFIKPQLRQKKIDVSVNTELDKTILSEYQLHFSVIDKNNQVIKEKILQCKSESALYSLPWDLPQKWSPDNPYLYRMKIELLRNSTLRDSLTTEFGHREFYTKGQYFYLNGKRINLFGDGWHFRPWPKEKIVELFTMLKDAGINSYRGHGPHPELWYKIADRMGMLMVAEGPTHQLYRDDIEHPDYKMNSQRTYTEWVKMIRQHPSIIIYSADNEVINGYKRGFQEDMPTDRNRKKMMKNLLRLADVIRQSDDTRPIMHEGDGALDGYADIVNMHYPHEAPFWHLFPQDTLWLENDMESSTWKYRQWKRNKPLYIGEFGKSFDISPRGVAFMAGDTAYYDVDAYYRGYGEIIRQMILGLRLSNCPGIAPWNTSTYGIIWRTNGSCYGNGLYDGIKAGFRHEAIFNLDYNNRVYAGSSFTRKLALFNDSLEDNSYKVKWELRDKEDDIIDSVNKKLSVKAGTHKIITVNLKNKSLAAGTEYQFNASLLKNGEEVDVVGQSIFVFHDNPLSSVKHKVLLYDPEKICEDAFAAAKLKFNNINIIPLKAEPGQVLIVAPCALLDGVTNSLDKFAATGGHVIVLSQTEWPDKWLNLRLPEKSMACTLAFKRQPGHKALESLPESATKYWGKDNIVSRNLFYKPDSGSMRVIIDSAGKQMGLKYAALLQGRMGCGLITCSQLDIVPNLKREPAAAIILKNLINQPCPKILKDQIALVSCNKQLVRLFTDVDAGVNTFESIDSVLLTNNTIIIDGALLASMNSNTIVVLSDAVKNGCTLLVTETSMYGTDVVSKLVGIDIGLEKQDYFQLALLQPDRLAGLSSDDLCWVVYDEWGCEYRHGHNKRWTIVSNALRIPSLPAEDVLMQTKPVLLGNMYGDSMRMALAENDFSFDDDNYPAMVEIPKGKGRIILCQIKLSEGYGKDKAAISKGTMPWNSYEYSIDRRRRRVAMSIVAYLKGLER